MMREAGAEKHPKKHIFAEQQHETDKLKSGAAATTDQEMSVLKNSIAKHESAYSSVCGAFVVERAGRASDIDQAQTMRRIHEDS